MATLESQAADLATHRIPQLDGTFAFLPHREQTPQILSVLIVDEDAEDCLATSRLLAQMEGFRVRIEHARSFEDGLGALRSGALDIGLIDDCVGSASGLELAHEMGGRWSPTPLILLTGVGSAALDAWAADAGVIDVIDKDELSPRALERAIRMALHTHKLEMRLTHALAEVESANRAKTEFLARMSHELRTPLNAINGFSEMIREQVFGPIGVERYREYAGDIHACGQLLLALINDLLDVSKIELNQIELCDAPLDLDDVIRQTLRLVEDEAHKCEIALVRRLADDVPSLRADRRSVCQMLQNLLGNALNYCGAGDRVVIATARRADGGIEILVSDNGPGIAPDRIEESLLPFCRGDIDRARHKNGSGLGLAIVKSLIELHGGSLKLASALGKGTTATLTFPGWRALTEAGRPASSAEHRAA